MVVGVWELVLFLWSHPIISCMVLVLFSPPFFPILVYFSPLLVCTGLVVVAMVSMNIGGSAEGDQGWRDGTRRLHEPLAHVETQLKPVKEGWMEWMRKADERIRARMQSRLFNFESWQFRKVTTQKLLHQGLSIPVLEVASESEDARTSEGLHESVSTDDDAREGKLCEDETDPSAQGAALTEDNGGNISLEEVPVATASRVPRSSSSEPEEIQPAAESQCGTNETKPTCSIGGQQCLDDIVNTETAVPEVAVAQGERLITEPLIAQALPKSHDIKLGNEALHNLSKGGSVGDMPSLEGKENEPLLRDVGVVETVSKVVVDDHGALHNHHEEDAVQIPVGEVAGVMDETPEVKSADAWNDFTLSETSVNSGRACDLRLSDFEAKGNDYLATKDVIMNSLSRTAERQEGEHTDDLRDDAIEDDAARKLSHSEENEEEGGSSVATFDHVAQSKLPERFIATETTIFVDVISAANSVTVDEEEQPLDLGTSPDDYEQKCSVSVEEQHDQNAGNPLVEDTEVHRWELSTRSDPILSASTAIVSQSQSSNESRSNELVESAYSGGAEDSNEGVLEHYVSREVVRQGSLRPGDRNCTVKSGAVQESDDLDDRFVALKNSMSCSTNWPKELNEGRRAEVPRSDDVIQIHSLGVVPRFGDSVPRSLAFTETQKPQPVVGKWAFESVEAMTDRLQKKFTQNLAMDNPIILQANPESNEIISSSSMAAIVPVPNEQTRKASSTFTLTPLVDSVVSNKGLPASENVNSKRFLASFLSRRRERLMTPLVEASSNSNAFNRGKKVSTPNEALTTTEIIAVQGTEPEIQTGIDIRDHRTAGASMEEVSGVAPSTKEELTDISGEESKVENRGSVEARAEGSTTEKTKVDTSRFALAKIEGSTTSKGRLIKEKMMSPLKRVFSLDANGVSSKKTDSNKVSSAKPSPVKEKQDKTKDRLTKLFSFDGRGLSKLEAVEADKPVESSTRSLRKSKSTSASKVQQDGAGEGCGPGSSPNHPSIVSPQDHAEEGVDDVKPKKDLPSEVRTIPTNESLQPEVNCKSEGLPTSSMLELRPKQSPVQSTSPPVDLHCQRVFPEVKFCLHKLSIIGGPARLTKQKEVKSSAEKKFASSWTKKKRCSEPLESVAERLKLAEEKVSLSGLSNGEEPREVCMSPLRRFHSASAFNLAESESDTSMHDSEVKVNASFRISPNNRKSPTISSPSPEKTPSSTLNPGESTEESLKLPEIRVTTPWWRRHSSRATKQARESTAEPPLTGTCGDVDNLDGAAVSSQKGINVPSHSWAKRREKSADGLFNNSLRIDDEELTARGNLHSRVRSESLPATGSKFNRIRERQPSSFSESTVVRTPDLSPMSSGRAASSLNSTSSMSVRRTDDGVEDDRHHFASERRNGESFESSINSNNIFGRNNARPILYSSTTMPSVRTQGLAQDLCSLFGRSDMNVNSLYRKSQQPTVAEIRITDKLKVPLEEVLSLLSTGEKDDSLATARGNINTGGAVADDRRQAASSSSSEDETSSNSSEEEWSSASEDEGALEPQPQLVPLPPPARIRRKLPHYIFNREATAN